MSQKTILIISLVAIACATFAQSTTLNLIGFGGNASFQEDAIVTIQSSDGTYINAYKGEVKSDQTEIGSTEKFKLIKNGDGTISLKTSVGTYLNADKGEVKSDQTWIGSTEKFKLIRNDDGTVSFKTSANTYINAHKGVVKADQTRIGSTEKFKLNYISQRIGRDVFSGRLIIVKADPNTPVNATVTVVNKTRNLSKSRSVGRPNDYNLIVATAELCKELGLEYKIISGASIAISTKRDDWTVNYNGATAENRPYNE